MSINNSSDAKFEFAVPSHVKKQLDVDVELLKRLPADYKDIFYPSVGNKIGKFFSSKEKKKFNDRKKILQYELQGIQKEVNKIYSVYYDNEPTSERCRACFNTIDKYCKQAGIKITPAKKNDLPGSIMVRNVLKVIRGMAKGMQGNLEKVKAIKKSIEQQETAQKQLEEVEKNLPLFQKLVQTANGLGIDTQKYDKMVAQWEKTIEEIQRATEPKGKDDIEKALKEYNQCDQEYDKLVAVAQLKEPNWEKLDRGFKKLLDRLIQLSGKLKELAVSVAMTPSQALLDVSPILEKFKETNKEVQDKIEFVKALENYYVFDWNMGVKLDDSLKPLADLKKAAGEYSESVKCKSQPCLPIAQGKKKTEQQYDHTGDKTNSGPYYILVNEKTKEQVLEAYTARSWGGTCTINKSKDEDTSRKEVDKYLQEALRAGTFKGVTI